ncbi:MAG: hypothetical protein PWQ93_381 [Clostridiales bacterium]|jgi:Mor family transcriptional regulator|nr:hypothetical protein [Clostridiales bacterium]
MNNEKRSPEWLDAESLPEPYKSIADEMGLENALKLAEILGGLNVYFPKLDSILRQSRDERIGKEFNGCNYKELAAKYGLTESWIRNIVNQKRQTD